MDGGHADRQAGSARPGCDGGGRSGTPGVHADPPTASRAAALTLPRPALATRILARLGLWQVRTDAPSWPLLVVLCALCVAVPAAAMLLLPIPPAFAPFVMSLGAAAGIMACDANMRLASFTRGGSHASPELVAAVRALVDAELWSAMRRELDTRWEADVRSVTRGELFQAYENALEERHGRSPEQVRRRVLAGQLRVME